MAPEAIKIHILLKNVAADYLLARQSMSGGPHRWTSAPCDSTSHQRRAQTRTAKEMDGRAKAKDGTNKSRTGRATTTRTRTMARARVTRRSHPVDTAERGDASNVIATPQCTSWKRGMKVEIGMTRGTSLHLGLYSGGFFVPQSGHTDTHRHTRPYQHQTTTYTNTNTKHNTTKPSNTTQHNTTNQHHSTAQHNTQNHIALHNTTTHHTEAGDGHTTLLLPTNIAPASLFNVSQTHLSISFCKHRPTSFKVAQRLHREHLVSFT